MLKIQIKRGQLKLFEVEKCPMCKKIMIDQKMGIYTFGAEELFNQAEKNKRLIVKKVICHDCDTR